MKKLVAAEFTAKIEKNAETVVSKKIVLLTNLVIPEGQREPQNGENWLCVVATKIYF